MAFSQLCNELQVCNFTMLHENLHEQLIERKFSKCNSFQVTTDLLNSENLEVAISQLCYGLQVCNFTML